MGEEDYSINTGKIRTFGTVDYVLFSLVFFISALIGVFYAFKDRNQTSTSTFMLAGKSMSVWPVAMSLSVTFVSALSLLGNPTEVYNFNTMFCWLLLAFLLAVAAAAHIFIPFFYRLRVTTVFEYLQMRFNTPVRVLGSVIIILQTLVYFSFVLYAPSLALSSVTKINLWGSVVAIGIVVAFYTTLGGMKAVLWTDTFQAAVIVAGLLAALIQGAVLTGGMSAAWAVAEENGRVKFDDFSFDPSTRHSFWSVVVGGGFFWMSLYSVNQAQVQRCISCPTVRKAQIALWVSYPCISMLAVLCFLIGLVMFAFYANCQPDGIISKRDQLLPLFVMDTLADYDGVPGIFVACIFSGSLSSLSSGLNAVSAVTIKDLIVPYCCPRLSDFTTTIITKILVVIYGGIGIMCAYLVGKLGNVLQAAYSAYSILNGPMFGLFLLGMFFPWANSFGAFTGCITSLVFMCWIGIGAFWHKVSTATLSPVVTTGCKWKTITTPTTPTMTPTTTTTNFTAVVTTTLSSFSTAATNSTTLISGTFSTSWAENTTASMVASSDDDPTDIPAYTIYTLSYLYYTITGATIVVVVGLIMSFISGHRKPSTLDRRLIFPLFDTLFPCLPECILRPLRFGVDHTEKYEQYDKAFTEMEADLAYSTKGVSMDIASPSISSDSGSRVSAHPSGSELNATYDNVGYETEEPSVVDKAQDSLDTDDDAADKDSGTRGSTGGGGYEHLELDVAGKKYESLESDALDEASEPETIITRM